MRAHLLMPALAAAVLLTAAAHAQTPVSSGEEAVMPPGGSAGMPDFAAHPDLLHVADELAELWAERPELFDAVDQARDSVIAWHRSGAWRPINVPRILDAIGEDRLLPILFALATDDPFALEMGLKAWRSWRVGLIESAGRLRDPRSVPLLLSVIEGEDPHAPVRRAAVSALGRTGDAGGIAAAIAVAQASPEKRPAVVEGLGNARRQIAADYLLEVARTAEDPALVRLAIRALGDWGNQMAWRTSSLAPYAEEGAAGRGRIVAELVEAYPGAEAALQAEIRKTLQLVDASGSAALAGRLAAESDEGERRAALQGLAEAMARSPLGARQPRRR